MSRKRRDAYCAQLTGDPSKLVELDQLLLTELLAALELALELAELGDPAADQCQLRLDVTERAA